MSYTCTLLSYVPQVHVPLVCDTCFCGTVCAKGVQPTCVSHQCYKLVYNRFVSTSVPHLFTHLCHTVYLFMCHWCATPVVHLPVYPIPSSCIYVNSSVIYASFGEVFHLSVSPSSHNLSQS